LRSPQLSVEGHRPCRHVRSSPLLLPAPLLDAASRRLIEPSQLQKLAPANKPRFCQRVYDT
jgi:hypothetical protein